MKLLVSVVDAGEARAAADGRCRHRRRQEPGRGLAGRAVARGDRAPSAPPCPQALPVSAAIGDMPNLPGTAALAALGAAHSGAAFVKVGLWGASTEAEAVALLRAVREAAPDAVVVAGAYADARRVAHAPLAPELLPRVARAAGVDVCLLDTAVKDGRGLLDWLAPDALTALVAEAHELGLDDRAGRRAARGRPAGRRRRPAPTSSASARPPARTIAARGRSTQRAFAPCARRAPLRRARLGEPGDVQPVRARACAALAYGGGDGVAPGLGRGPAARDQVIDALLEGSVSIRQRRPKPTCQRSSRSIRSAPSRTPGSAPSARSSSSAFVPALNMTPSSSMW